MALLRNEVSLAFDRDGVLWGGVENGASTSVLRPWSWDSMGVAFALAVTDEKYWEERIASELSMQSHSAP
jgi:hypothetical protein